MFALGAEVGVAGKDRHVQTTGFEVVEDTVGQGVAGMRQIDCDTSAAEVIEQDAPVVLQPCSAGVAAAERPEVVSGGAFEAADAIMRFSEDMEEEKKASLQVPDSVINRIKEERKE